MEEKVICYYCGTVYDRQSGKCPLCGSTRHSDQESIPQRRERRERTAEPERKKRGGKFAAAKQPAKAPKGILVAALVFLILAVGILTWFIGDMLGWWPGLEDGVERESLPSVEVNESCTSLRAEPARLDFAGVGEELNLTVYVNLNSNEKLYCTSANPEIVSISQQGETAEGETEKSVTFTLSAVAQGETTISIVCGKQSHSCPVTVGEAAPEDTTSSQEPSGIDPNFTPELNRMEIKFEEAEATVALKVTNLPDGAEVIWRSSDEAIASVDANGVVTAVSGGEASVFAEVNGKETEVKVVCDFATANNNDGAHLESTDVSVKVGDKFPLYLYNSESEHIDDIVYIVDDSSICKVENNYVTALSGGTTTVRVVYNGEEYTCIVRVSW